MNLTVEQFVDNLLSDEAYDEPSDKVKVDDLEAEMKLPEWFDEKKYNQGRRFFLDFVFGFETSFTCGLISLYAIPSILNIFIGTRRSNSTYTAYKRYSSTFYHNFIWLTSDLKPGSLSWKSLYTVRSRHLRAGRAARLKNTGTISQRDISLTLFTTVGFVILKPDKFGVRQLRDGDWEGYSHFWRVIGYMLGLQDRYNMCQATFQETRQVIQLIADRVFTPCLENVPEYFEHLNHVTIDGLRSINSGLEKTSILYLTKYFADVPGYIYTEGDRLKLQEILVKHLKGRSSDTGVETTALMQNCAIKGLPNAPPRLLYLHDYDSIESAPAYKQLPFISKYKLAIMHLIMSFYSTNIGRPILNMYYKWTLFLAMYFPYMAMYRFGIKRAFVDMFKESPMDDAIPIPNSEYNKPAPPEPWYKYDMYRPTFEETRQVFQIIADRLFTPCLENVPEYFEHMYHVTIDGLKSINAGLAKTSILYLTRYVANVPGYIYTKEDRLRLQEKLKKHLKGTSPDTGVETTALTQNCAIKGLPNNPPRLLYLHDYGSKETAPAYNHK